MKFNITWPIIEFFVFYGLRLLYRIMDSGIKTDEENPTKTTTIQQYVDLYCGPEYQIHFKYSSLMNMAFISFMYGAGLPVMFPICFVSVIVLYMVERLCVAYSYKQPPMYDDKLNKSTLNMLYFTPLLYGMFGWWMYTNKQFFDNEVGLKHRLNESPQLNHTIGNSFSMTNQSAPLLVFVILYIVFYLVTSFFKKYLKD